MWTNVFRIGELHLISWFQFVPCESDSSMSEKSSKAEKKDAATMSVLSAHLNLQNGGFLSAWTNNFVGPWDPSQGVHNPDEKIKLWLFLPGRHTSVVDAARSSLSGLRVIGNGTWLAPGNSEEVALALSQALRNCIERSLKGLYYVRYGDVFVRCPFSTTEKNFRRPQPALEFIFSSNDEAVYVHVIISAKNVRGLSSSDLERVSRHDSSRTVREGLPVIVAPNGLRGRITGCCPSDLVKQAYTRKMSSGSVIGLPSLSSSCQLRGQSCYVEVTLGCPSGGCEKQYQLKSGTFRDVSGCHLGEDSTVIDETGEQKRGVTESSVLERTFIFPVEAVLVPVLYKTFIKSCLKRIWLQSFNRASTSDALSIWKPSSSSHITESLGFGRTEDFNFQYGLLVEPEGMRLPYKYSNSSNSSSISSTSSVASESDDMVSAAHDPEADADSLTCRQSGSSQSDQFDTNGSKMVAKRSRTGMTGSSVHIGNVASEILDQYRSESNVLGPSSPSITGRAKNQVGSRWDWDDDGMDIEILLSEFGSFGDFFEDDLLSFGEPPGTAESQAVKFSPMDFRDASSSPCHGKSDTPAETHLPASNIQPFEEFNQHQSLVKDTEVKDTHKSVASFSKPIIYFSTEYDHLKKAEALITLASEYSAVETPTSEFSTTIFRSPYLPKSKRVESPYSASSAYVYGASPPSPILRLSEDKNEGSGKENFVPEDAEVGSSNQSLKYYNHVRGRKTQINRKPVITDNTTTRKEDLTSSVSGITLPSSSTVFQHNKIENILEAGHLLLSVKTVLATEIECMMFQATMCRIRHIIFSLDSQSPMAMDMLTGRSVFEQVSGPSGDPSRISTMIPCRYEVKKKDTIPVRIAGDSDSVLDHPVPAPVGVWRSVGAPKVSKSLSAHNADNSSSFISNILLEEDLPSTSKRQPLHELLDALAFLVQQSVSFVDISLDNSDGDGPYNWLALQEQIRRGFACGPPTVHAGCGGILSKCHSLDIAGVELVDPLSTDVHASSVINLLHSDVKVALKNAFGNLDGPLFLNDWCKGHNQHTDAIVIGDNRSVECNTGESKESSSAAFASEPISPSTPLTGGISSLKEGARMDEPSPRRTNPDPEQLMISGPRFRPTISVLPAPALLVGYQDDWLKTSGSSLELWEKAPLEPYALPKPVTYCALCPDIDILTSSMADFLQQIGTVYETCKLGTHSPHLSASHMDAAASRWRSSGLVLIDCPQKMKAGESRSSSVSSLDGYFLSLYQNWNMTTFLSNLVNVLKNLKLSPYAAANQKDGSNVPCMVIYVVCPFPEPTAVLQTLIESSAALGSKASAFEREGRTSLHSQVEKAQNCASAAYEASVSNVVMLSGFSIPRIVLQIVSVDLLLRVNKSNDELAHLKDVAFTVYNKARRIVRPFSNNDVSQSSSGRSHSSLMHVSSPTPGLWKDCLPPRISALATREGEFDSTIRSATWENSWQTQRTGGLNCDSNRSTEFPPQDELRCLFEPLFILAEPGSVESGMSYISSNGGCSDSSNLRSFAEDGSAGYMHTSISGVTDGATGSVVDGSDHEQKVPSLHCCYGWTEDWRWLVCIWTDARGELLDSQIFPFGGISSRQDTKALQCLFVQVLHQGCQILSSLSTDSGSVRARDITITRIGCFFELECQEWQKAIYQVGGNEVKKWPLQLRQSLSGISLGNGGAPLQKQDISSMQERGIPSSPSTSMYSPSAKSSSYVKGTLGQINLKKSLSAGQTIDGPRGLFQLVQSITLVSVSIDHSLQLILPADVSLSGGSSQNSSSSTLSSYLEGFSPVKSLGTTSSSYMFIPYPNIRYLPPSPQQLPTCLTSESPPLAHLLHSKGFAIPLSTGYVVSKAIPCRGENATANSCADWPSVLSVSLVDHYGGGSSIFHEKISRSVSTRGSGSMRNQSSGLELTSRDYEQEGHLVLESVAAELNSLSWMTVSPVYPERRSALPFHCDMLLRLRRLLYYAEKELSKAPGK